VSVDHATRQVEQHASDVVRAVMRANASNDPMQVAFDVIGAALLVCGDDPVMKSALALFMLRMARRLDHDVTEATTLQ
jgi:hypothetical protein